MKRALTTCFSRKNAPEALNLCSTCEYEQTVSLYSKVRSANTRVITQRARIKPKLRALNIPCVLVVVQVALTYKAINGLAPFYLQELISLKEACKYKLRSDCDGLLLNPVKFKTLTTLGDRSFAAAAPQL